MQNKISKFLISKFLTSAVLGLGFMMTGFTASAATITLIPSAQNQVNGATFSVDVIASGLPAGTAGGGLDISWTGDMVLDSVYLATTDSTDSNGGLYMGNWDPVSSFFSGPGTIGAGSLTGLFVGSFDGVDGVQAIARLNFTMGSSSSVISAAEAAFGGTWAAWDGVNAPYSFLNDYESATINAVPVPAALWLFGSGLVGLAGVARRRA